jgi:cellulose synthase operon protein C
MRNKINLKLLVWILGGLLASSVVVFGIHFLQYQRIASALLWQANRAEEQGENERMTRYLRRYLEFAPRDIEEKARLARALTADFATLSIKGRRNTLDLLESVLVSDPSRKELRRLLVKSALTMGGRPKLVRDHLTILWKSASGKLSTEERGELEGYEGQLAQSENDKNKAGTWYRKAIEHTPEEQTNYVRLAYLLRGSTEKDQFVRKSNESEADRLINDMVQRNKESHLAYLARWNYRRAFDQVAVENLREESGTSGPNESPSHTDRARLAVRGGSLEDAGEDIRQALTRAQDNVEVLIAAADMERLLRHRREARAYLERGLALLDKDAPHGLTNPLRPQLLWHLTNLLMDNLIDEKTLTPKNRNDDSLEVVQRIGQLRHFRGQTAAADYLDARMRLLERRWSEAKVLLERSRQTLGQLGDQALQVQINIYLGQCYEQLEEPGQMYAAFRRVADVDPTNAAALLGMGAAQWLQGRLDDAMDNYQKVMNLPGIPTNGWSDISRLEIQRQMQREPNQRDWTRAEKALEKAVQPGSDGAPVAPARLHEMTLLKIEMLGLREKFEEAEKHIDQAFADLESANPRAGHSAREADLWASRSRLALRARNYTRVAAVLNEAEQKVGNTIEVRLARVQYLAAVGRTATDPKPQQGPPAPLSPTEVTAKLQEMEQGVKQLKLGEQAQLLDSLAEAHFRMGNNKEGRRLCQELSRHVDHQSDLRLRLLLFDLAMQADDVEGVEKALEDIRTVDRADGSFTRYGQAVRLLWLAGKGKMEVPTAIREALAFLDAAAKQRPNWPQLHLARAQIAMVQGNTEERIKELKQAMQLGDTNPTTIRQLVEALREKGRTDDAWEEVRKLKQSQMINTELGRLAASTALSKGDTSRALELAQGAVAADSKNFRDHLWMGLMFDATGKGEEAKTELRRAIQLAPKEPEPYVAMVRFLMTRKDSLGGEAKLVLEEAARAGIDPKKWPLTEAMCWELLGIGKESRAAYERALLADPENLMVRRAFTEFLLRNGQMADAEKVLRAYLALADKLQAGELERAWGKRTLAVLLADGTDFTRFQEALDLVGVRLDSNGHPVRDRNDNADQIRAQARVLATQQFQRQFRERALELFDELNRTQSLTVDDKFVQALLQDTSGNWAKAREQLKAIAVGKQAPLPQYLIFLARRLIHEKDYEEAERWIEQLKNLEMERKLPPGTFATVDLEARLLEGKGQGDKAIALLREYSKRRKQPGESNEEVLLQLTSLVNQKRYADALETLQKVWQECRPEAAGAASVSLLRQMKPTDEQVKRVEDWLKSAIEKSPKKMVLRLQIADLYDLRGRYPEAIEALNVVLRPENEPNNVVALNNLAWILAHRADGGERERALAYINTAVKGLGKRAELLDTRGIVYLALGRTDQALADLKEVNNDAPSPSRMFHLARAHYQAQDRDSAAKVLKRARDLNLQPDDLHPAEQKMCRDMMAELKVK